MIQIEYICPKCGGKLEHLVLASYPPQYIDQCTKCDWKHATTTKIVEMPFPEKNIDITYNTIYKSED